MPGFGPVGSVPVAFVPGGSGPAPGTLKVSEQATGVAMVGTPTLDVSEQATNFAIANISTVVVTEQSVAIALFVIPAPPPPPPARRRQYYLM